MINSGKIEVNYEINKMSLVISLDEELYIKILPFNKFIGVIETGGENELLRKL